MAHAARKIVIAALATGGIVAGVATASATPLRTSTSVSTLTSEEQRLHAVVAGLDVKEQALEASLRARRPAVTAPVTVPTAPGPDLTQATTSAPAPNTHESTLPTGHTEGSPGGETATSEPTSEHAATATTTTTEPTEPTTSTTSTSAPTGSPDDETGGGHSSDG
jgi:hypothetical protein